MNLFRLLTILWEHFILRLIFRLKIIFLSFTNLNLKFFHLPVVLNSPSLAHAISIQHSVFQSHYSKPLIFHKAHVFQPLIILVTLINPSIFKPVPFGDLDFYLIQAWQYHSLLTSCFATKFNSPNLNFFNATHQFCYCYIRFITIKSISLH